MTPKPRITRICRLVSLATLALAACSPTDSLRPEQTGNGVDATDANRIVLSVLSTRNSSGFFEFDTISIAASIVSASGAEILNGAVTWQTPNGFSVLAEAPRVAALRLNPGSNVVSAFFRNRRGVLLEAHVTIQAIPAKPIAVVWGSDGSITEIPQPENVRALYPRAINDRGEVVGTAQFDFVRRAFIWSEGLGFRIIEPGAEDYSEGRDINDDGIVAGIRRIDTRMDGFLWTAVRGFVSLDPASEMIVASGINNSGVVAGIRNYNAVRWSSQGGFQQLPMTAGGKCSGTTAIGSAGHVIGWVGTSFDDGWCLYSSPVVWAPDGAVHTIYDCRHQIDCVLQVTDINGTGEVVGNIGRSPFRWTRGGGFRELLGDAGGVALGLNELGEVAGSIEYPDALPIVWDRNDHMRVLPLPSRRHIGTAHAINNKGQVVGVVR